jgi:hypothetical protein
VLFLIKTLISFIEFSNFLIKWKLKKIMIYVIKINHIKSKVNPQWGVMNSN